MLGVHLLEAGKLSGELARHRPWARVRLLPADANCGVNQKGFFMSRSLQYPDGCLSASSVIIQSCNVLIILHFFSNLYTETGCSMTAIYHCPNWFGMVCLHLKCHCV